MEKIYIHNKLGVYRSEELGENYKTGTTWEDVLAGCFVPLSKSQVDFWDKNPAASIQEIWNKKLNKPVVYEPTLEEAKAQKISEIDAYDRSSAVNEFILYGIKGWLGRDTRMAVLNLITIMEATNPDSDQDFTLCTEGDNPMEFTAPLSVVKGLMYELELYAKSAYDATQRHKTAVRKLETVEEVEGYEYKGVNYPQKLNR